VPDTLPRAVTFGTTGCDMAHKRVFRRVPLASGGPSKAYYGEMNTVPRPNQNANKQAIVQRPPARLGPVPNAVSDLQRKQRRRMLVAAILLLIALGVILTHDGNQWFGDEQVSAVEVESNESATHEFPHVTRTHSTGGVERGVSKHSETAFPNPAEGSSSIVTDRKALPPLEVEVVAGGIRRAVQPGSGPIKVGIGEAVEAGSSPILQAAEVGAPAVHASQRVTMSADTAQALAEPVDPAYPVLARQMKVQGSVAIQALISADGAIQDLHVLNGPNILASAAQEAVRQWRFKPYLQNGQPVETQARITVNFTISTF